MLETLCIPQYLYGDNLWSLPGYTTGRADNQQERFAKEILVKILRDSTPNSFFFLHWEKEKRDERVRSRRRLRAP